MWTYDADKKKWWRFYDSVVKYMNDFLKIREEIDVITRKCRSLVMMVINTPSPYLERERGWGLNIYLYSDEKVMENLRVL